LTAPRAAPDAQAPADDASKSTKAAPTTPRKPTALDPHAAADRVRDLYNKGNFAEAIALLKELEKQAPSDPQYKSQIALYYAKIRDAKNATAYFSRFKQVSSDPAKVESLKRLLAGNGIKVDP
jgi:Flp pilus assembly protein TadD